MWNVIVEFLIKHLEYLNIYNFDKLFKSWLAFTQVIWNKISGKSLLQGSIREQKLLQD